MNKKFTIFLLLTTILLQDNQNFGLSKKHNGRHYYSCKSDVNCRSTYSISNTNFVERCGTIKEKQECCRVEYAARYRDGDPECCTDLNLKPHYDKEDNVSYCLSETSLACYQDCSSEECMKYFKKNDKGKCEMKSKRSRKCHLDDDCFPNLHCKLGFCQAPARFKPRGVGESCENDNYCEKGLKCHEKVCLRVGSADYLQICAKDIECQFGMKCVEVPVRPEDEYVIKDVSENFLKYEHLIKHQVKTPEQLAEDERMKKEDLKAQNPRLGIQDEKEAEPLREKEGGNDIIDNAKDAIESVGKDIGNTIENIGESVSDVFGFDKKAMKIRFSLLKKALIKLNKKSKKHFATHKHTSHVAKNSKSPLNSNIKKNLKGKHSNFRFRADGKGEEEVPKPQIPSRFKKEKHCIAQNMVALGDICMFSKECSPHSHNGKTLILGCLSTKTSRACLPSLSHDLDKK